MAARRSRWWKWRVRTRVYFVFRDTSTQHRKQNTELYITCLKSYGATVVTFSQVLVRAVSGSHPWRRWNRDDDCMTFRKTWRHFMGGWRSLNNTRRRMAVSLRLSINSRPIQPDFKTKKRAKKMSPIEFSRKISLATRVLSSASSSFPRAIECCHLVVIGGREGERHIYLTFHVQPATLRIGRKRGFESRCYLPLFFMVSVRFFLIFCLLLIIWNKELTIFPLDWRIPSLSRGWDFDTTVFHLVDTRFKPLRPWWMPGSLPERLCENHFDGGVGVQWCEIRSNWRLMMSGSMNWPTTLKRLVFIDTVSKSHSIDVVLSDTRTHHTA